MIVLLLGILGDCFRGGSSGRSYPRGWSALGECIVNEGPSGRPLGESVRIMRAPLGDCDTGESASVYCRMLVLERVWTTGVVGVWGRKEDWEAIVGWDDSESRGGGIGPRGLPVALDGPAPYDCGECTGIRTVTVDVGDAVSCVLSVYTAAGIADWWRCWGSV
jgi:hypothetical protein